MFTLLVSRIAAADLPFRAHARMTMVNFKNGEPFQTNSLNLKVVLAQGKWSIYMGSEDWETESAVYFDGTNQYSVSYRKKEPLGQTLNAFAAESEVPYGGQLG